MIPSPWRAEARAVLRLALPAVAQSLLQTMVFVVDRVMLGRHSASALASMQVVGTLVWSLQSIFASFSVGTVAVVGRCVGARDAEGATSALRGSVIIAAAVGAAIGLSAWLSVDGLVALLGGDLDPAVREAARGYLRVMLPAMPALFLGIVTTNALQAAGDTRTPFAIAALTNVVNVIGNAVLIFGAFGLPRLGATGAALSNAFALSLEAALGLWALSRAGSPVRLSLSSPGVSAWTGARRVLAVSVGSFGERVIYHAGYLSFVRMTNGLGPVAMAAHQALLSLESVSFMSADGFAVASSARVAQNLGAGDVLAARRSAQSAAAMCAAALAVFALVFVLAGGPLVAIFQRDPAIVAAGRSAIWALALAQVPMGVAIVMAQSLRGAGATRDALLIAMLGTLAVRISATWGFTYGLGLGFVGVWMGSGTDWTARMLLGAWRWRRGRWSRVRV
ncbi:MAG: MATE family efflux transporter [Polyangiales bacterium]